MTDKEYTETLKGTTLHIYRFLLNAGKPLGIREIQKALSLSSPSIAQYHLTKLARAGLVKKEMGNYVITKTLLKTNIKIGHYLIPKYFFYSMLAALILIVELTILPEILGAEDVFAIFGTLTLLVIFCYEAIKVWLSKSL